MQVFLIRSSVISFRCCLFHATRERLKGCRAIQFRVDDNELLRNYRIEIFIVNFIWTKKILDLRRLGKISIESNDSDTNPSIHILILRCIQRLRGRIFSQQTTNSLLFPLLIFNSIARIFCNWTNFSNSSHTDSMILWKSYRYTIIRPVRINNPPIKEKATIVFRANNRYFKPNERKRLVS